MSFIRFNLDLAIKQEVYDAIPLSKRVVIRDAIRALKAYAVKINEGLPNEEMTVKATWHKCHHDTGGSCEEEFDI